MPQSLLSISITYCLRSREKPNIDDDIPGMLTADFKSSASGLALASSSSLTSTTTCGMGSVSICKASGRQDVRERIYK